MAHVVARTLACVLLCGSVFVACDKKTDNQSVHTPTPKRVTPTPKRVTPTKAVTMTWDEARKIAMDSR